MAGITTAMASSFKKELMEAIHNFNSAGGNVFKMALIKATPTGTYDATSTNYSNITGSSDEVSGAGYTAGGDTLTNSGVTLSGTTAYTTFSNPSWSSATFSSDGCMIYNSTAGGNACGVFSFGGTQQVTSGTFTVLMPTANASSAILRLQ